MNTLETERLVLRLPERGDFDVFADMWADPEMLKDLPFEPQPRAVSWTKFLQQAGSWSILGYGNWLVFEKSGSFVGVVGFFDASRGLGPDFDDYRELGYVLSPAHYGKGYATEACSAALKWMDDKPFGKHSVCMVGAGHAASIRVAEKCGYVMMRETTDADGAVVLFKR